MLIEMEPKDWAMVRTSFLFIKDEPDMEDAEIKDYLRKNGLAPKRVLSETREGFDLEVWQYGQCYLGKHLNAIDEMFARGVRHRALMVAIWDQAKDTPLLAGKPDMDVHRLLHRVAHDLLQQATFSEDEQGVIHAAIAPEIVERAFSASVASPLA